MLARRPVETINAMERAGTVDLMMLHLGSYSVCLGTGSWMSPPQGEKGSKGRNELDCIRGKGPYLPEESLARRDDQRDGARRHCRPHDAPPRLLLGIHFT